MTRTKTYEITRPRFRFSKVARRVAAAFAVLCAAALFLALLGGNPASAAMVGWDYSRGKPPANFSCKSVQNIERAYLASYQKYPGATKEDYEQNVGMYYRYYGAARLGGMTGRTAYGYDYDKGWTALFFIPNFVVCD